MIQDNHSARLAKRREFIVSFRWLLILWLSASILVRSGAGQDIGYPALWLLGGLGASQALFWNLPLRLYEGIKVFYAVFLLDLLVILSNLALTGSLNRELLIALFLGTFIAALTRKVASTCLAALVLSVIYFSMKSEDAGGFNMQSSQQLLDLPFLLIASIHSGLVAQEADTESGLVRAASAESHVMELKFKETFLEAATFNRNIKAMLDALPYGVIMLDKMGAIKFFNVTSELVFGVSRDAALGSLVAVHANFASLNAVLRRGAKRDGEFQMLSVPDLDGAPSQIVLSQYRMEDEQSNFAGTLLLLAPVPFYQSVAAHIAAQDPRALVHAPAHPQAQAPEQPEAVPDGIPAGFPAGLPAFKAGPLPLMRPAL